jgi:hypothetical protein
MARTKLTTAEILAWADAYHERTGEWPIIRSGLIPEALGENWRRVDNALRYGLRGLPGGSSLARLLDECRGVRNVQNLAPLTEPQVLLWADAHHRRTGDWPNDDSGPIADAPGEVWRNVDMALREGHRGFPGGSSLAQLLAKRRGVPNRMALPALTVEQILSWADAHHRRTGTWPKRGSGPIADAPGETWAAVDAALSLGNRGLPGGSSLAQLLQERRGVRNKARLPRLTAKKILAWADAHYRRTGRWQSCESGPIPEAPGETWLAVQMALVQGLRGLRGGSSLHLFLRKFRRT